MSTPCLCCHLFIALNLLFLFVITHFQRHLEQYTPQRPLHHTLWLCMLPKALLFLPRLLLSGQCRQFLHGFLLPYVHKHARLMHCTMLHNLLFAVFFEVPPLCAYLQLFHTLPVLYIQFLPASALLSVLQKLLLLLQAGFCFDTPYY